MPENTSAYEKFQHNILYQFLDLKERYVYYLNTLPQHILPGQQNHTHYLDEIKAYSQSHPEEEILSVQAFACHGMMNKGTQVVLTNSFDENTKFYHFIHAENNIRSYSSQLERVYFIALFACCRENFVPDRKKGCGISCLNKRCYHICPNRYVSAVAAKIGTMLPPEVHKLRKSWSFL